MMQGGGEAPRVAKEAIDASVRRINGFGRLRWGRAFGGVSVSKTISIDCEGRKTHRLSIEPAYDHMLPEDYADMLERMGRPRPELPAGLDVINALEGNAVTTLAATNRDVARVLHYVDLMLQGDEDIDWVAAYAALEVIEQNLRSRQLDGQALGWWTGAARDRFRGTANSVELLGFGARQGWRRDPPKKHMTSRDASWFIRRITAYWVKHLLDEGGDPAESEGSDPTV